MITNVIYQCSNNASKGDRWLMKDLLFLKKNDVQIQLGLYNLISDNKYFNDIILLEFVIYEYANID